MVLVTGGTGFIGSHLVETLCAHGQQVRCLVRPSSRKHFFPSEVELAYGDLRCGAGLEDALQGADTVIHLAGVTKALSPADYYTGNVDATENLARAVARRGIRLVHVSSLAAIGPSLDGLPLQEDAEPHPLTHYGKSKLKGEQIVQALVPDAVIARPPAVYGPRDTDVFQLLRAISKGLVLQIGGGDSWFSAIYVKDLVDGLLAAAAATCARGRTYFLAHAKVLSWSDFGAAAARVMGRKPLVMRIPAPLAYAVGYCAERWSRLTGKPGIISREKVREAECRHWTCATERAAQELRFQAQTSLESGLAATLAWYKEAGWLTY